MPRQINFKVVFIWQSIVDPLDQWLCRENLFTHLVHGVLDAGALFSSEESEGDLSRLIPGLIEFGNILLHCVQVFEGRPLPACVHRGTEDTVVDVGERGEVVADEVVEFRTSAFEDEEVGNARPNFDALAFVYIGLNQSLLVAISVE